MDSSCHWAGIDTSTRSYSVCILGEEGAVLREETLPADAQAMVDFLAHYPLLKIVALETGTTSIHLARALRANGLPVEVYHALKVHRFLLLQQNKTDANDARGIAEVARVGGERFLPVFLRPLDLSVLRSKLVTRERLIKSRKLNEHALMSLLHSYGVRADARVTSPPALQRIVEKMVRTAEGTYRIPIRTMVTPLVKLSISIRREELRLEKELSAYAAKDEICRRFMEIPGIGPITAVSFKTAIGDPTRFRDTADVGAYLGLTPKVWQTGVYKRRRGISKLGNNLTRKHLHTAARQALDGRTDSPLQRWARALAERSNRKKAIVALARKLAVLMLAMWKNETRFDFARPDPRRENRNTPHTMDRTPEAETSSQSV